MSKIKVMISETKFRSFYKTLSTIMYFLRNDEDEIPNDELPYGHPDRDHKRSLNFEQINLQDKGALKRAAAMNKNVLLLASVSGNPSR